MYIITKVLVTHDGKPNGFLLFTSQPQFTQNLSHTCSLVDPVGSSALYVLQGIAVHVFPSIQVPGNYSSISAVLTQLHTLQV